MKQGNVDLLITNPEGFDLADEYTEGVTISHDQDEALKDADFVYAKNWSSYTDYGKIGTGLDSWMISKAKMELTNNANFMHCLPVRRNVIVADEVLDSDASLVMEQAHNRAVTAQTILLKMLQDEK